MTDSSPSSGQPRILKQKYFIDSHKIATGIFVLILMAAFNQWHNPTAWVYLALHGTYGILWVTKSRFFPDKGWEQPSSIGYGLFIWSALTMYWVTPIIITWQGVQAPEWYLAMCIIIYTVGMFLHYVSDMQKHMSLQLKPGTLLTGGLWQICRNPNYLGEFLIYLGFGLLAMHWIPVVILLSFVAGLWIPNMLKKDKSLSRYPEFAEYKARTKRFIPFVW